MPLKSVLFVPATNERAMTKVLGLGCDAIIYDLEDSVFNDQKTPALGTLVNRLTAQAMTKPSYIRLNKMNALSEAQRLRHLFEVGHISGFVLSKLETAAELLSFKSINVPLMAMIETPLGLANIKDIAGVGKAGNLMGLILGPNDMRFNLKATPMKDRAELVYAMSSIITHARANGLKAIDGVYNQFSDLEGFEAECSQGRALGFDGKTLIHPSQIDIANRVFAPTLDERIWAEAVIAAFEAEPQKSLINFGGEMLEMMHLARASEILSQ